MLLQASLQDTAVPRAVTAIINRGPQKGKRKTNMRASESKLTLFPWSARCPWASHISPLGNTHGARSGIWFCRGDACPACSSHAGIPLTQLSVKPTEATSRNITPLVKALYLLPVTSVPLMRPELDKTSWKTVLWALWQLLGKMTTLLQSFWLKLLPTINLDNGRTGSPPVPLLHKRPHFLGGQQLHFIEACYLPIEHDSSSVELTKLHPCCTPTWNKTEEDSACRHETKKKPKKAIAGNTNPPLHYTIAMSKVLHLLYTL